MYKTLLTIPFPGLTAKINWSGLIALDIIGVALFAFMVALKDISIGSAFLGALAGMMLHYTIAVIHQGGHAIAAKRTGYPMELTRTYWVLSMSVYPKDEPELPAEVHIRRALGGQYLSFPLFILACVIALLVLPDHGVAGVLAVYFVIDSLSFSLGAFTPLPLIETDGKTILHWWPKRGQSG